jgi:hypothetical protein
LKPQSNVKFQATPSGFCTPISLDIDNAGIDLCEKSELLSWNWQPLAGFL